MAALNLGPQHGCEGYIQLERKEGAREESGNVMTILRNPSFRLITLKFFYQWFVVSLLFYGFYYSLDALSGSVTVNFVIMAVLEV